MPVGREVAVLVVGAGDEAEAELAQRVAGRRRGPRPADAALGVPAREAVPVRLARREAPHLEMHRMGKGRLRDRRAGLDDRSHPGIRGDLVGEGDIPRRQPPGGGRIRPEWFGRQAGPEHEAVRPGLARGHAESEGVAAGDLRADRGGAAREFRRGEGAGERPAEEAATTEGGVRRGWDLRPVWHGPMIGLPGVRDQHVTRLGRWTTWSQPRRSSVSDGYQGRPVAKWRGDLPSAVSDTWMKIWLIRGTRAPGWMPRRPTPRFTPRFRHTAGEANWPL